MVPPTVSLLFYKGGEKPMADDGFGRAIDGFVGIASLSISYHIRFYPDDKSSPGICNFSGLAHPAPVGL